MRPERSKLQFIVTHNTRDFRRAPELNDQRNTQLLGGVEEVLEWLPSGHGIHGSQSCKELLLERHAYCREIGGYRLRENDQNLQAREKGLGATPVALN